MGDKINNVVKRVKDSPNKLVRTTKKIVKKDTVKPKGSAEELKEYLLSRGLIEEKKEIPKTKLMFVEHFIKGFLRAAVSVRKIKDYRRFINSIFGGVVGIYPDYFTPLKDVVDKSDIKILPDSYISIMTGVSFFVAAVVFSVLLVEAAIFNISLLWTVLGSIILPLTAFFVTFSAFYVYPFLTISGKQRDIEANLPFGINHMSAIASSGVPPEKAFELLAEFGEYGALSKECEDIVKEVKVFGEDVTTAIRKVAIKTASPNFKEILYGILSTIESGGNLKAYLNEMAKLALFNYQLKRKKYIETLSTYADIYTAILIAAPLFLIAVLAVMNIVPGSQFGGFSIDTVMFIGIYVGIPLLNLAFLAFVSLTQPEV